jgi:hypothetical protein
MYEASLNAVCHEAIIVAYKEDTSKIEHALTSEGFATKVFRGSYTEVQLLYSANIRCLINHANAWRYIAGQNSLVIVVEADFVPVIGFGQLPLPFRLELTQRSQALFGWLYSSGSILYGFDQHGFPHGHGNTMCAYVLTPEAAKALLCFYANEMNRGNPGEYRAFDTYIGIYMRKQCGILNHIPIYQYGEHGGLTNPEHRRAKLRGWHQADILWNQLHFTPQYARDNQLLFRCVRFRGWTRGVVRLLTLRYFDPWDINADSSRSVLSMASFSILRMLGFAVFCKPWLRRYKRRHEMITTM